ncbi:hypothetical protein [Zhaonella formicivorans]|jgi:hypothetical protein|nr:hypothetical protein [Zhaonella formicivorans]
MKQLLGNLLGGVYAGVVSAVFLLTGLVALGFLVFLLVGRMGVF